MSQGREERCAVQAALALPYRLLQPSAPTPSPVIICFHGSGESCSSSWDALAVNLSTKYRILLYDRGSSIKPPEFERELSKVIADSPPPYVLVAHSYGGAFARHFLQVRSQDIAGMVMVETGQETSLDPEVERSQYQRQILGSRPLSVIRGNSLIDKYKALQADESSGNPSATLEAQRKLLEQWDAEDERLKKAQLALSRNHRYVHVPCCGHNVIRDRPDVVSDEVRWVMEHLSSGSSNKSPGVLQKTIDSIRAHWTTLPEFG
jgi:pimeloyl-ACP methyl ester carboxylesterase